MADITALEIRKTANKTWIVLVNGIEAAFKGQNLYHGGIDGDFVTIKAFNGAPVVERVPYSIIKYVDTVTPANTRNSFATSKELMAYGIQTGFFVDGSSAGSGGPTSFTGLDDTPDSYIGRGGQVLKINESETAVISEEMPIINVSTDLADFPATIAAGKYLRRSADGLTWEAVDGVEGDQNNVGLIKFLGFTLITPSILTAVSYSNFVTTVITEQQTPVIFTITQIASLGSSQPSKVYPYLFLAGKGTYGSGGTPINQSMLFPLPVNYLTAADIENDPEATIYNLDPVTDGDFISKANLAFWDFQESTYPDPGQNFYFSYTDDGVLYYALFVGEPDTYGVGGNQLFVSEDFITTANSNTEPEIPLPSKTSDLENDGETGDSKYTEDKSVYKLSKIEYPKDITFRPFNIFEHAGLYYTDLRPRDLLQDKISKMKPYYVNYQTGSNSNNGLTEATAFKTIAVAYANNARLIYLTGGIHKIDSWSLLNSAYANTDDLFIIGIGKEPTTICSAPAVTPTITLQSGTTYQATDANIRLVADMKYVDSYGYPLKLTEYFSIASVNSNAGSYYYDTTAGTLYFNLTDGRLPDNDVLLLTRLRNAEYRANAGYHYVENINFVGGGSTTGTHGVASQLGSNSTLAHLAQDCKFMYGQALNYTSNGGEGSRNLYNKLNWFDNCVAYGNARDGFNYLADTANSMNFIEVNCPSFENDWRKESNNTNGSSFHGGGNGIRINGKAFKNSGPNFADVDGAVVFNVNCLAGESTAPDPLYNSDFAVETNIGMQPSKAYLYDCVSLNEGIGYSITGSQPSYIYVHPLNYKKGGTRIVTPSAPQGIVFNDFIIGFSPRFTFPVLSTYTAADPIISQTITNGITTRTPSEDAVFDALALKANLNSPVFTNQVTFPNIITVTGGVAAEYMTGTGAFANLAVAVQGVTIGTLTPNTTPLASGITFKEAINRIAGAKQDLLISGTNVKTINGGTILGSGNLVVGDIRQGGNAFAAPFVIGSSDSQTVTIMQAMTPAIVIDNTSAAHSRTTNNFAGDIKITGAGDVEVTNSSRGVILKSPNGTRYRITVSDTGVLTTTSI